jgi:transaldolase
MTLASSLDTSGACDAIDPKSRLAYDVLEFVRKGIDLESTIAESQDDPFWYGLREQQTELWLDTGDIDSIGSIWNRHFSGLTTNNTLLNDEIQKGTYDHLIQQSGKLLGGLQPEQKVREVAFLLNARHGLRLVAQFGCRVSVELHTDVASDDEASIAYARRFYEICPQQFVVKVPFTPAGLIATRKLRKEGIPVNLTLGFSARQNYLATALANPSYVNVFLGRLNSYVADNGLGDGRLVGEKATLASQQEVNVFAIGLPQCETRQIAASIRDGGQLTRLAGVDVITIPPQVAKEAMSQLADPWRSRLNEEYDVSLLPDVDAESVRLETLWSVSADERKLVEQMILQPPKSEQELIEAASDYGVRDLFPQPSPAEMETIAADGKIPQHKRWGDKIMHRELAIDSLMTVAGLAQFAASQQELDARIREQVR